MNQDKLVSIIIPIYNAESHIDKCLKSLLNQTYMNIELILIDDGSTDKSLDICKKFQDKDNRIKIISIKNSGPSVARNAGLKQAEGELVQFVDSDDFVEANIIEVLASELNNGPQLVVCGYNSILENVIEERYLSDNIYDLDEFLNNFANIYGNLQFQYLWNKMYDLNIIKKYGIKFNEETKRGEDILFNIDYLECCDSISVINDRLYNYVNYNTQSLTKNYNEDLFIDQKRVFKNIRCLLKKHNKYNINKKEIERLYIQRIVNCFDNLYARSNNLSNEQRYYKIKEILYDSDTSISIQFYKGTGLKWIILKVMMLMKSVKGTKLLYDIKHIKTLKE